jgi:Ca2+-binding EF-hand superfamily protein
LIFLKKIALKKHTTAITIQMAKDFLDTVDTDGDGKISKEELFNYYKKD